MFSSNTIKGRGNEWEMGNVLYIFIEVDLWLFFIFQGWEIGCVLESGSFMKKI